MKKFFYHFMLIFSIIFYTPNLESMSSDSSSNPGLNPTFYIYDHELLATFYKNGCDLKNDFENVLQQAAPEWSDYIQESISVSEDLLQPVKKKLKHASQIHYNLITNNRPLKTSLFKNPRYNLTQQLGIETIDDTLLEKYKNNIATLQDIVKTTPPKSPITLNIPNEGISRKEIITKIYTIFFMFINENYISQYKNSCDSYDDFKQIPSINIAIKLINDHTLSMEFIITKRLLDISWYRDMGWEIPTSAFTEKPIELPRSQSTLLKRLKQAFYLLTGLSLTGVSLYWLYYHALSSENQQLVDEYSKYSLEGLQNYLEKAGVNITEVQAWGETQWNEFFHNNTNNPTDETSNGDDDDDSMDTGHPDNIDIPGFSKQIGRYYKVKF